MPLPPAGDNITLYNILSVLEQIRDNTYSSEGTQELVLQELQSINSKTQQVYEACLEIDNEIEASNVILADLLTAINVISTTLDGVATDVEETKNNTNALATVPLPVDQV